MTQVFLSHSTEDAEFAQRLADDLRDAGIPVWKAPESIQPGQGWIKAIEHGLSTSTHMVLLMSPDAVESKWVNWEFDLALRLQVAEKMVIIPVEYIPCNPPLRWGHSHWIRGIADDYHSSIFKLIKRLRSEQPANPPLPAAPATTINISVGESIGGNVHIAGGDITYSERPESPPSQSVTSITEDTPVVGQSYNTPPLPLKKWIGIGIGAITLLGVIYFAIHTWLAGGAWGQYFTKTHKVDYPLLDQSARTLAENGVSSNAEWTPAIQISFGTKMALVPAGCFMMGSKDGDSDETPVHEVCFDKPFWIDMYEVTNKQYGLAGSWSGDDRPRERVSWLESAAYCESRGARLPTEAEWEYAARGPDGLIFPWGDDFVKGSVTYRGNSLFQTAAVGNKPDGASWIGAHDLSGNVWEWVNDWYDPGYYASSPATNPQGPESGEYRVLRGGSWSYSDTAFLQSTNRVRIDPSYVSNGIGFRCARDYE